MVSVAASIRGSASAFMAASLAQLRHAALLNRLNKRDHYLEAMAKAFLPATELDSCETVKQ